MVHKGSRDFSVFPIDWKTEKLVKETADRYTVHTYFIAITIAEGISMCYAFLVPGKYLIIFLIQEVFCAIDSSPVREDEESTLWQILV